MIEIYIPDKAAGPDIKIVFYPVDKEGKYQSAEGAVVQVIERPGKDQYHITLEKCPAALEEKQEEVIERFRYAYLDQIERYFEDTADGLESEITGNTMEEGGEPRINVPYDPNTIRVIPARFSLKEVYDMINGYEPGEEPILDLSPDFQREYVWDKGRQSRLIESILLKIPLPVFYLARDKEGKYQIVDGMQRLTTINNFFNNGFRLMDLEYLREECGNCYFKNPHNISQSLHPKFVRQLRGYQIDCNVIEPETPEAVKLDIFKRLNTGGKGLNKQEVRHAFMKKEVREFLKKFTTSEEFLQATDYSIKPLRMMDQEMVLRFIGFYCLYYGKYLKLEYSGDMSEFLDNVAIALNSEGRAFYQELLRKFKRGMNSAYCMFDRYAFRKIELLKDGKGICTSRNQINRALFTGFSVILAETDEGLIEKQEDKILEFAKFLSNNVEFANGISLNTNYNLRLDGTVFMEVERFLKETYKI